MSQYFVLTAEQREQAMALDDDINAPVDPVPISNSAPGVGSNLNPDAVGFAIGDDVALLGMYVLPKRIVDDADSLRYAPGEAPFLLTLPICCLDEQSIFVPAPPAYWNLAYVGTPLDLSGATEAFSDDFTSLSVTADDGAGPWYAPSRGNYGFSTFQPPSTPNIFIQSGSELTLRNRWNGSKWLGAHMQTMNSAGVGFSHGPGYFEAKIRMNNPQVGSWPAFWLKGINSIQDASSPYGEIDVFEGYSGTPTGIRATWHKWRPPPPQSGMGIIFDAGKTVFDNEYHLYGVEITSKKAIVYFDRLEIGRFTLFSQAKQPMFLMLSHALYATPPDTEKTLDMVVDYVKVFAR